jgi:diguanylate cyclase (GGDEF)-like protein/PAS domain S-box-containing protein
VPAADSGGRRAARPVASPLTDDVLFTRAPGAIVAFDDTGNIRLANPAAARLFQRDAESLVGCSIDDLLFSDDRELFHAPAVATIDEVDCRVVLPDGTLQRCRFRVVAGDDLYIAFVDDLTEQLRNIADAENSTGARYEKLLQNIDDVITVCDANGLVLANLGHYKEMLGRPASYWEGGHVFDYTHPDETDEARQAFQLLLRMPGVPIMREFRTRESNGHWAWLQFTATNLLDDPTVNAIVLVSRNVTRRKQNESLQRTQSEIFELIACAAPLELVLARMSLLVEEHIHECAAGFFVVEDGALRVGNGSRLPPSFVQAISGPRAKWFGSMREALVTGRRSAVTDVASSPLYDEHLATLAGAKATVTVPIDDDLSEHGPCGALAIHLADSRSLTKGEELVALAAARLAAIALQRHRNQQQLFHLAHHDRLTGLPNRANLQTRLDDAIGQARAHNTSLAVMFLDVDNFKIVNDSLGHSAGDHVLVAFAERLAAMLRPDDTVGRFGGDEFVVLLENITSADDAVMVAERLLEDLQHPLRIGDQTVFLSVSVGISLSIGGHDSADVLLRNADSAMYQAKARGRARVEVFDDGLPERSARRLQLEGDLHRALDHSQFVLHWQPKVQLDTGRIVSAEALVRWNHPERGLIQPTEFIRVTEEMELIVRIGAWVLEEAIKQRAEWEAEHGDEAPWSIAVNVSALQLAAPRAMESVIQVLERWHWAPERLVLELTESVLMDEAGEASPILRKLKQLGVKIAIDDFGTGYSSLSYLHRYPVDQVKLDRSFVGSIDENGDGSVIARAVINMAHALGITVTAEGVETETQLLGLRALNCDRAQGFLFSHPLPAEEFSALLRRKPRYGR